MKIKKKILKNWIFKIVVILIVVTMVLAGFVVIFYK